MGFLDFIKNIFKEKKEPVLEKERIKFEDIFNEVQTRKQKLTDKQKSTTKQLKELLSKLIIELEEKTHALEDVDLTEKKEPERVKLIVKQNLNNFIHYLKKLISNLKDLEDIGALKDLINKINSSFSDFEKKSLTSFQKATFIIGKELGGVRDSIAGFFKSFKQILEENKISIEKSKILEIVEKKLESIDNFEKNKSENNEEIKDYNEKLRSFEENIESINEKIEEIKKTPKYLEQIKNKQEIEKNKDQLSLEIQKLRQFIDFKKLANVYHSTENKMPLVKEYRENFKKAFEKHSKDEFLDLVDIKEIDLDSVKSKIEDIKEIENTINSIRIEGDEIPDLENEINKIKFKMVDIQNKRARHEKLNSKINESEDKIKEEINKELEKIDIILEY